MRLGLGLAITDIAARSRSAPWGTQAATRSFVASSGGFHGTATGIMSRSSHTTRGAVTALRIVLANWYVSSANGQELAPAVTAEPTASIEYPAGTFTQVKWGGSATGSIPSGETRESDTVSVTIPDNTQFWVRILWKNAGGGQGGYYSDRGNSALGDRLSFDPTDRTMAGSVADDLPGYCLPPAAIIAQTTKRSAIFFGDSRFFGTGDTADVTGDIGIIARGAGPQLGYCNAGIPSDREDWFLANSSKRQNLARYFTDVVVGYGVNGAATIQSRITNIGTIYGLFPTKRVRGATSSPHTTGAWANADGSDQTVAQDLSVLNSFVRGNPSPLYSYFDAAAPVSIVATPTKWKAGHTADGIHENQTGAVAVRDAGVVDFGLPKAGNLLTANQGRLIGWSGVNTTVTTGVVDTPEGAALGAMIVENGASAPHYAELFFSHSVTASVYEWTGLIKRSPSGAARDAMMWLFDGAFAKQASIGFNLSTVAVNIAAASTTWTGASGRAVYVGDGWWRVTLRFTADVSTNLDLIIAPTSGGGVNYAGNGTSGILVANADLRKP